MIPFRFVHGLRAFVRAFACIFEQPVGAGECPALGKKYPLQEVQPNPRRQLVYP